MTAWQVIANDYQSRFQHSQSRRFLAWFRVGSTNLTVLNQNCGGILGEN